jgi:hypothetical protein
MSHTPSDIEKGEPVSGEVSPTPTIHRVMSAAREHRVRGDVPLELVGAILEKGDAFVVTFDNEQDPRNPQNWP